MTERKVKIGIAYEYENFPTSRSITTKISYDFFMRIRKYIDRLQDILLDKEFTDEDIIQLEDAIKGDEESEPGGA